MKSTLKGKLSNAVAALTIAALTAPVALAAPTANTSRILMDREATKGSGMNALAANTVGNTSSTTLIALYTILYVLGFGMFVGGWYYIHKQNKQEENQRKYFAGVSGIVIGVLLAVGTSAFGLMSDTMGFGNLIDKGIDSDLQLDQGQSGRGLKDPKTNW